MEMTGPNSKGDCVGLAHRDCHGGEGVTATVGSGLLLAAGNPGATARRERWLLEAEKTQETGPLPRTQSYSE